MAKYISIPTANASIPNVTLNTDLITSVLYGSSTRVDIWVAAMRYRFDTSTGGAASAIVAINNAILAQNGPQLTQVVLPAGVTITSAPTVTTPA